MAVGRGGYVAHWAPVGGQRIVVERLAVVQHLCLRKRLHRRFNLVALEVGLGTHAPGAHRVLRRTGEPRQRIRRRADAHPLHRAFRGAVLEPYLAHSRPAHINRVAVGIAQSDGRHRTLLQHQVVDIGVGGTAVAESKIPLPCRHPRKQQLAARPGACPSQAAQQCETRCVLRRRHHTHLYLAARGRVVVERQVEPIQRTRLHHRRHYRRAAVGGVELQRAAVAATGLRHR